MSNISTLIQQETNLINRTLKANGVRAKALAGRAICVEVGFLRYPLKIHPGEKFAKVEGVLRELSASLARNRQRLGAMGAVPVLPVTGAGLALEVPHPGPKPLLWSPRKMTTAAPHSMLIGKSYLAGPRMEHVAFDDSPHVLIAGITGAGKSVLLQTMLLSLCAATSPDDLKLVLVDLKNEDLVPFENLPHVLTFAGRQSDAVDAIKFVNDEKERRIDQRNYKPYRLVLVIDEMAQLAGNKDIADMLGNLASIGRSKAINLIGATQHPTDKGGLGTLLKANFPIRLVGMVAPGQSYVATGRPQTHADLLPGKGAFLRCQGPDVFRFQSFYIEQNDVSLMAKYISKDIWKCSSEPLEPVLAKQAPLLVVEPRRTGLEPVLEPVQNHSEPFIEPLGDKRPLTPKEALQVQRLYQSGLSKTALCKRVYGSKNGTYAAWIDEALNGGAADPKIIQLRRAS